MVCKISKAQKKLRSCSIICPSRRTTGGAAYSTNNTVPGVRRGYFLCTYKCENDDDSDDACLVYIFGKHEAEISIVFPALRPFLQQLACIFKKVFLSWFRNIACYGCRGEITWMESFSICYAHGTTYYLIFVTFFVHKDCFNHVWDKKCGKKRCDKSFSHN